MVAADLLARRRIPFQVFRWRHPSRTAMSYLPCTPRKYIEFGAFEPESRMPHIALPSRATENGHGDSAKRIGARRGANSGYQDIPTVITPTLRSAKTPFAQVARAVPQRVLHFK